MRGWWIANLPPPDESRIAISPPMAGEEWEKIL